SPVKVTCARLAELCNGLDDDGDGLIDEGLPIAGSTNDDDMDGYFLCPEQGQGLEADCNDQNPLINPAATEICDGLDNDCDGAIDEGDPGGGEACTVDGQAGACAAGVTECFESVVDCMQTVFPVGEVCNGVDDDCDGAVDEDFPVGGTCEVGVGACAATGTVVCNAAGDGTVCDAVPGDPTDELCDGLDNDCDGAVDEDFPVGGTCEVGVGACAATGNLVCNAAGDGTTCDATPGDPTDEVCDGLDNDCDGAVDNGDPGGGQSCGTTDVGACEYGVTTCSAGSLVCVGNVDPVPEACGDGADNDCDGTVDEGLLPVAVCSPSQDLLNVGSQSTSFKFNLESLVNACDPANPAPLDAAGITAAYVSRAGDAVLADPLSLSCPDITGSFLGERGIVEDFSDRQVTGNDVDLKFNRPADGDCRTLDGTRQDLFALVSDQPNNAVVPVCFKSTFDGVEFECCMEATVRNTGNR
ncbi:MAG: putative metal-binding motif-containing protein, partial [Acidobacteriota bacterium]